MHLQTGLGSEMGDPLSQLIAISVFSSLPASFPVWTGFYPFNQFLCKIERWTLTDSVSHLS